MRRLKETFGHIISEEDEIQLANLIYYPDRQIAKLKQEQNYTEDWQRIALYRLVQICKEVSSKYSRSKVRKKMPPEFAYAIDEFACDHNDDNKKVYYSEIIRSIIDTQMADSFIIALCRLIQNLTIDNLHIIGDIFDRGGPRADIIMEELMQFHDVDIQWGNHDISWMGASTGNPACISAMCCGSPISYNGFDVLEDGYGINIRPLSMFAAKVCSDDPCERFMPRILDQNILRCGGSWALLQRCIRQ